MKRAIIFLLFVYPTLLPAQDTAKINAPLSVSGYAEVYYQYDVDRPANHTRPLFVYNHNRTNEVALNLGYVKASYTTRKARANLALMAGTYANANLASEPGVLKNVYEASVGMRLSPHQDLWLDAGILPSHIGFESAVGKDCWTLTRSILADNSPYYEAGLRTSYRTPNEKWYLAILLLNGWQRIQRVDGNNTPAFGTQVAFIASPKLTINSSTFIGNNFPDSTRRWRYFHNFYSIWELSGHWALTIGFDTGIEQNHKGSGAMNPWYAPVVLLRYQPVDSWSLTGRWEYYRDKFGVIITGVNGTPFEVQGASLNVDYRVVKNMLWRLEGRSLWGRQPFFIYDNILHRTSITATTSFCFGFD